MTTTTFHVSDTSEEYDYGDDYSDDYGTSDEFVYADSNLD